MLLTFPTFELLVLMAVAMLSCFSDGGDSVSSCIHDGMSCIDRGGVDAVAMVDVVDVALAASPLPRFIFTDPFNGLCGLPKKDRDVFDARAVAVFSVLSVEVLLPRSSDGGDSSSRIHDGTSFEMLVSAGVPIMLLLRQGFTSVL